MPRYKNGKRVGGVGLTEEGTEQEVAAITGGASMRKLPCIAQSSFASASAIWSSRVLIDGIRVPGIAAENAAMAAGVAVGSCEACALAAMV